MLDVSGVTVVTNACAFYHCTRGCGRAERPAFPAPSKGRAERAGQASRETSGEIADAYLDVIARSASDEAIHICLLLLHGLLRGACHRARIRATRWLAMTVVVAV